jgi:hypothetical protein
MQSLLVLVLSYLYLPSIFDPVPHNLLIKEYLHCRQERRRKPDKPDDFVTYDSSDSEEETPAQQR